MSEHEDGGAAFPVTNLRIGDQCYASPGMSLRDYFATAALQGMLASGHQEAVEQVWIATGQSAAGGLALAAYGFADAMLKARE